MLIYLIIDKLLGQYLYFENSTSNMELEILDCEENDQYKLGNYLYKYRESNIIKSW